MGEELEVGEGLLYIWGITGVNGLYMPCEKD